MQQLMICLDQVGRVTRNELVSCAHCLYSFSLTDNQECQQYVSPACVSGAVKSGQRRRCQVAMLEHSQEAKEEANLHGRYQGAQAGRETAQMGEEMW